MNKQLIKLALDLTAEAKNARMMEKDTEFDEKIQAVFDTIKALAKLTPDKRYLKVGDTVYDLAQYMLPKNILTLVNATNIYANVDSVHKVPIIRGDWGADVLDEEDKVVLKTLTPAEFNAFWTRWNSNQYNAKVECIPCNKVIKTLMDVGAIQVDGGIAVINSNAEINELVARALGLSLSSITAENADKSIFISDEEVALWLISI